jgi:hypothetical protein
MPAVDDFPPVGQREYRARLGTPGHSESPAPRKASLLERLTGVRRRNADGRNGQAAGPPALAMPGEEEPQREGFADEPRPPMEPSCRSDNSHDEIELPVFFDQQRKS